MNIEIRRPDGQPLTTADRSQAVAESLRQIARMSRFADRKKGIRSYQSHVKSDPWLPILFVLCFVLPATAGAVYYGFIASDRFVTEARFAVRPAVGAVDKAAPDSIGTSSGVPKEMLAQDVLITYQYVQSRPMLEAVEAKLPIREWFGRDSIDMISRFDKEQPIEKLLKYWRKHVEIEIDGSHGIMALTVTAFDPAESLAVARAVLAEAERMVNQLSMAARNDAVVESNREMRLTEEKLAKVRLAVRDLRNRDGVLDAQKANEANLKVIGELRAARINLAVQMTMSLRDLSPETRRIQDMKAQIKDLDENIARIERQSASQDPEQKRLLSDALTRYEALNNERSDTERYYARVIAANERARIVAARQVEFFSPIVEPVMAESSTQPRRLLMSSLIAAGSALLFAAVLFVRKLIA